MSEHVALYNEMVADAQARPEKMRRVFVPDDFAELVRFTIRNHEEFSLAELVERLLLVSRYETEFVEARESESRWERFYSMKRFVPSSVKFPVKSAVGNALSGIIEARYKARFGGNLEPLEEMDRQVLEYFRKADGVDLETAHADLIKRALEERAE